MDRKIENEIARIKRELAGIENKYDANEDIIPGAPKVLYTEMRMVKQLQDMLDLIEELQERVEKLEADENQKFLNDLWRVDE